MNIQRLNNRIAQTIRGKFDIQTERKATALILICLTHIPLAIALTIVGAIIGSGVVMLLTITALVSFASPLPLIYLGKFHLARAMFILNVNVVAVTISCVMSPDIAGYLYFYNTLSVPMLLFDSDETRGLRISYLTTAAMLLFLTLYKVMGGPFFTLDPFQTQVMFLSNFAATFLFLLGVLGSVHHTYTKFEKKLKKSIDQLEDEINENKSRQVVIDEQRALIIEKSRLSKLGEMAASVAHEINNPLSVIDLQVRQLDRISNEIKDVEKERKFGNSISKIKSHMKRISTVVKSFKNLSRDANNDPFVVSEVESILAESVGLVFERFRVGGVRLTKSNVPSNLRITCRPLQIEQILVNLLNNAYDAVVGQSGAYVQVDVGESNGMLTISVSDNGPGVPKELEHKIMTPFFTTKAVGLGTGIGLSIAKQIANEHDGDILYSRKDGRTRFSIHIPLAESELIQAA